MDLSGYDAGKQVKGKKRHGLVDTLGLVLHALESPANVQDRDGGSLLFAALGERFPLLEKLFADGAYQGLWATVSVNSEAVDGNHFWSR